jgi:hypothetical protein
MFQIIIEEPTKKIDKIIARREEIVERREERRMTDKNVKKGQYVWIRAKQPINRNRIRCNTSAN